MTPITREFAEKFGVAVDTIITRATCDRWISDTMRMTWVLLGHIVHSEGETHGKELLRKSYAALRHGGKLLIAE